VTDRFTVVNLHQSTISSETAGVRLAISACYRA